MRYILLFIFTFSLILNFTDALFTSYWVDHNIAVEMNPIMDYFIQNFGIYIFILFKMIIATVSMIILYLLRHNKFARFGLYFTFTVYFLINLYHIIAFFVLFFSDIKLYLF